MGGFRSRISATYSDALDLFIESIRRPATAAKDVANVGRGFSGLLIILSQVILIFVSFLIHLPLGEFVSIIPVGFKNKLILGLLAAAFVFAASLIYAILATFFKDTNNPDFSFLNILGMYGTAAACGTIFVILIFIFGFFSSKIVVVLFLLALMTWMFSCHNVTKFVVLGDENKKSVLSNLICILATLLILFIVFKVGNSKGVSSILYSLF